MFGTVDVMITTLTAEQANIFASFAVMKETNQSIYPWLYGYLSGAVQRHITDKNPPVALEDTYAELHMYEFLYLNATVGDLRGISRGVLTAEVVLAGGLRD